MKLGISHATFITVVEMWSFVDQTSEEEGNADDARYCSGDNGNGSNEFTSMLGLMLLSIAHHRG